MVPLLAGVIAGIVTTLAGMGGGTLLVLFLVAWSGDPVFALAATSVGLLVGNAHRAWMFRTHVRKEIALPLVVGAVPAALAGALLAVELPTAWVRGGIAAVALVGVAVVALGIRVRPPNTALGVAGGTVGLMSATTGGGGLLAGPFLLANGLSGPTYIATGAVLALSVHVGRLVGYASGTEVPWAWGLAFAVAIPVGNLVGKRIRPYVPERAERPMELGVAGALATLTLAGLS